MVKRILLSVFVILLAVIIYDCDDAGVIQTEKTYEVTGTVTNWTLGVKYLKAVVKDSSQANTFLADSTSIASNGSFTLNAKTPPDNYFYLYSAILGSNCTGSINITPAGLKNTSMTFEVYDSTNTRIGHLQRKNYDVIIAPGSFTVQYGNFLDDGTVSGSTTCIGTMDTTKVTGNYSCTKGWNKVILVWNQFRPPTYYDLTIQSAEPPGAAWYMTP